MLLKAGRVSLGGRRNATGPPGTDIMRKKAPSRELFASILRIHAGSSPTAETALMTAHTAGNSTIAVQRRRELREYFNGDLPGSNIVGIAFRGTVGGVFPGINFRGAR